MTKYGCFRVAQFDGHSNGSITITIWLSKRLHYVPGINLKFKWNHDWEPQYHSVCQGLIKSKLKSSLKYMPAYIFSPKAQYLNTQFSPYSKGSSFPTQRERKKNTVNNQRLELLSDDACQHPSSEVCETLHYTCWWLLYSEKWRQRTRGV